MAKLKTKPKIGVYGPKTRELQKKLSYERTQLSWKEAYMYLYQGSRENTEPNETDIQVTTFMETPDRAYDMDPKKVYLHVEQMSEQPVDLSRLGIMDPLSNEQTFKIHVNDYECLGRRPRSGDILEIPFYEEDCKKAYWVITDVDPTMEFEKFYSTLQAKPADDARETREIPLDQSNEDIFADITDQQDQEHEDQVPHEDVDTSDYEVENDTDTSEPFDPRKDNQGSFLDDPDKMF